MEPKSLMNLFADDLSEKHLKRELNAHPLRINERNLQGDTPLIHCCAVGNWECAKLLIERGSNVMATNSVSE